jgi:fatty-acid desaturase
VAVDEKKPWQRNFFWVAKGKSPIAFYLLAIHVLAAVGILFFPVPGWNVFLWTLLFTCLGGLGTTVGYHRTLSHRTVKMNPFVEHLLTFFAMFNGSGAPASWVAYHRHHHIKSDTEDDVSSPKHGGFWWAHLRWLWQSEPANAQKYCPEFTKGMYGVWTKLEIPVIVLSLCCGLPLVFAGYGWAAFFWMGAMRLVYSLHMQCFVNSLTHLGKQHDDTSQNVWWLGPLQLFAWGENWHRNHHSNAGSARLGLKWYEIDIGWYFIWTMEKLHLAHNVRRPRKLAT